MVVVGEVVGVVVLVVVVSGVVVVVLVVVVIGVVVVVLVVFVVVVVAAVSLLLFLFRVSAGIRLLGLWKTGTKLPSVLVIFRSPSVVAVLSRLLSRLSSSSLLLNTALAIFLWP